MSVFTIQTKQHGMVDFQCKGDGGYVYVRTWQWPDYRQIAAGGSFRGPTLRADRETLAAVSRKWWGQYLRALRAHC